MLGALLTRDRLDVNVLHDRNPVFVTLSDGSIRNGYTIKILNMRPEPRTIGLSVSGLEGATMTVAGRDDAPATSLDFAVKPDKLLSIKVYVKAPPENLSGRTSELTFTVTNDVDKETARYDARFEGPEK